MHPTSRRSFLLAALAAAGCGRGDSPRSRAARYLWAQQADDGGWHSRTYGLLRSGQSLTPFVLDALLDVSERPAGAVERAVEFIKRNTNTDGSLGLMDSVAPDYPNYATGLGLRALTRANALQSVPAMIACMRNQQFTELNGWNRADAPYGAWGMGGVLRRPPDPGHVDLAMTRYVLEGLAAAGVRSSDPALQSALVYLERCQNPDGGFFFSTVEAGINKAGEADANNVGKDAGKFRSYGSTTADGVLALRAAGVDENDPRIVRAKLWLRQHHLYDRASGFEGGPRETWAAGLRFYYAAAIARAMPELSVLLPPQHPDGSFVNSSNLVKEDDPLIATAFALRVLAKNNQSALPKPLQ